MKIIFRTINSQSYQKSNFSYLDGGKTTFKKKFWPKSKNQNFAFLKIKKYCFFKIAFATHEFFQIFKFV
jgi:hypothetical protein